MPFEEARADAVREVGLEDVLEKLGLAHLNPAQRHQIDALDALGLGDARRELDATLGSDLAEVVRRSARHIELNIADFEVCVLLEDAGVQLEERHEESAEEHLVVDLVSLAVLEVVHDGLLDHEQLHTLQFVDTAQAGKDTNYLRERRDQ